MIYLSEMCILYYNLKIVFLVSVLRIFFSPLGSDGGESSGRAPCPRGFALARVSRPGRCARKTRKKNESVSRGILFNLAESSGAG